MSGFKTFVLKGNLVDLAVAVIIGVSFGAVVTTFTAWLTSLLPKSLDKLFSDSTPFGAFMNAVISFVILAAVVYYFVVVPYVAAREKFFPTEEPGVPADIALLTEIRDALQARG
jgi:large conductance mechanosensitive channel